MSFPGFTATSSLGKSTVTYRQISSRNLRRPCAQMQPALMMSDPLRVVYLLDTGGFWGGPMAGTGGTVGGIMGGEGVDTDVGVPVDLDPSGGFADAACRKCLSACRGTAQCHRKCQDQGVC
jgi:hypothetical protein